MKSHNQTNNIIKTTNEEIIHSHRKREETQNDRNKQTTINVHITDEHVHNQPIANNNNNVGTLVFNLIFRYFAWMTCVKNAIICEIVCIMHTATSTKTETLNAECRLSNAIFIFIILKFDLWCIRHQCQAFPNFYFCVILLLWYQQKAGRTKGWHQKLNEQFCTSNAEDRDDDAADDDGCEVAISHSLNKIEWFVVEFVVKDLFYRWLEHMLTQCYALQNKNNSFSVKFFLAFCTFGTLFPFVFFFLLDLLCFVLVLLCADQTRHTRTRL